MTQHSEVPSTLPADRADISTEKRNPRTHTLHALSVSECVDTINTEDRRAFEAVKRAAHRVTAFIEAIEPGFIAGGRLIYVGAGTSGRLGVLDASEAPPTFQLPEGRIIGIIAGGDASLRKSSESREDDPRGSWPDLATLNLTPNDALLAIAAGGTTPYALGAMEFCKTQCPAGAPVTGLLCCTTITPPPHCDYLVTLKTGPEVLTGSTRMKAGTATKLVLNTISTTLMIRSGRVYQNLMVDLRATNDKLRDRAARIVSTLTGLSRPDAFSLLQAADGSVKAAILMHRTGRDLPAAAASLDAAGGNLARALGEH
ncbi:MAG: N-acetylmuramic acid 6-phosphate etherase [Phycisphaeraceae bacterium]|nr:N-acetylmuramic acid 6-phosphate etherase [Phycisphaeraceae bacterium]